MSYKLVDRNGVVVATIPDMADLPVAPSPSPSPGPSPAPAPSPSPAPAPAPAPAPIPTPSPSGFTAGQWTQVPNTTLPVYSGPLAAAIAGNTGPSAIMGAWCGAAWDVADEAMIVWGGGHTDYLGNEVYRFHLASRTWDEFTQPGDVAGYSGSGVLADGDPSSRHTYDGLVHAPGVGMLAFSGCILLAGGGGGFVNQLWLLDATGKWTRKADLPGSIGEAPDVCAVWDPNTATAIVASGNGFARYNPATDTWATMPGQLPDYHMTAAFDPVRKLFVAVSQGNLYVYDTAAQAPVSVTPTGDLTIINTANAPGFTFDQRRGLFVAWDGGKTLFTLDANWNWAAFTPSAGDTPPAPQLTGTFGRFRYDVTSDVYVLANDIAQDVFVFAPPFGAAQPAPPPNQVVVTHSSGQAQTFSSLAQAQPAITVGDTVDVFGSTFAEGVVLPGAVTLRLNGITLETATVQGGVGLVVTNGAGNRIVATQPSVIRGVHNSDGNGSGVRQVSGGLTLSGPLTVTGCDDGLLSSPGCTDTTVLPGVVFDGNGASGVSQGHNVYVQAGSVLFQGESRNPVLGGHALKCRAPSLTVQGATLRADANDPSRCIDMANGGDLSVSNTQFFQGPVAENTEMVGYGGEGITADGRTNQLSLTGNTVTTSRPTSRFLQESVAEPTTLTNNHATLAAGVQFTWGVSPVDPSNTPNQ